MRNNPRNMADSAGFDKYCSSCGARMYVNVYGIWTCPYCSGAIPETTSFI